MAQQSAMDQMLDADVLVIGAGTAGLSAARALAQQGFRVLVLEAQGRVGGRICTLRLGEEIIELGAEFVHGQPRELLALIEEAGLRLVERSGSRVRSRGGKLIVDDGDEDQEQSGRAQEHQAEDPFAVLEELQEYAGPDITFAEYLEEKDFSTELRESVIGYVEGFNAADHRVIGVAGLGLQQKAEDAIGGDRTFHISGGYDQLTEFLAAQIEEHGSRIQRNTVVQRIVWCPGRVDVCTNQGSFSATRVVVALPLGVLQRGGVRFDPALFGPLARIFSSDGPIRMGSAVRFSLNFQRRFWETLQPVAALSQLSFLMSPETIPSVWWTTRPEGSNMLTGWIGGPRSMALAGLSAEALTERSCQALAHIFHLPVQYLRGLVSGCFAHDWENDPYALGAYSYVAKGGIDAPPVLATPVEDTLYFVGEHTTTDGHWGTVHAAHSSGLRAAKQIAAAP